MKTNTLLLSVFLTAGLVACGQEKSAEVAAPEAPAAPAATETASAPAVAPEASAPAAGADVDGHALYEAKCASCHGPMGEGLAGNPKLAGLKRADIESRLSDYRAGKQMGPKTAIMAGMAKPLSDEQISALAQYIGE